MLDSKTRPRVAPFHVALLILDSRLAPHDLCGERRTWTENFGLGDTRKKLTYSSFQYTTKRCGLGFLQHPSAGLPPVRGGGFVRGPDLSYPLLAGGPRTRAGGPRTTSPPLVRAREGALPLSLDCPLLLPSFSPPWNSWLLSPVYPLFPAFPGPDMKFPPLPIHLLS